VIKALHRHFAEAEPGRLTGVFAKVVDRRALRASAGPPVVVQEYVEHEAEFRVYHVDGDLHAFEVRKRDPADPWLAPDRVTVVAAEVPTAIAAATRKLASALALRYGAFDYLLGRGQAVFLEVNPDGDWRWAERRAGSSAVTLAVSRMLHRMHHRGLPPNAAPGNGAFDLLAFLSG
jgi:hypothetical protein